jgi:Na+/H+ antiporter NhaD/arsenite permease-like protein
MIFSMIFPIIVLAIVFVLIAVRRIGNIKLQIWQIMLGGAVLVLLFGSISPWNAIKSINVDVILFLFGMFVIGEALEKSGYLSRLEYKLFSRAKTVDALLLFVLFGIGFLSALLMNDTLAIIGTPVVLLLARRHNINAKVLLLALCFAVTIGSAMSPIGNPQNLLIAINGGMKNPFFSFIGFLIIPTIINLFLAYVLLKFYYKNEITKREIVHVKQPLKDENLARLAKWSILIVIFLILLKVVFVFLNVPFEFRLTYIALLGALPVIILSNERFSIVRKIDWSTLIFFVAMFILMQAVWISGFFQGFITGFNISGLGFIFMFSVVISQFISNVPLVALYLPMLMHAGASTKALVALGAASTIAGNLLILGAASNVIIIQNAESKSEHTITFWEFARIGIPLTVLNCLVYLLFLYFV